MSVTTDPIESAPGTTARSNPASPRAGWLRRVPFTRASGVFVLGLFILVFGLWVPATFLTATTAQSIASDQSITVILSMGVLFALACGEFDLSCAQLLGLSAVVGGSLMAEADLSPVLAVVLTLAAGLLVGAVNGALVAFVGVNSFIATLGMSSLLLALTELISNQEFVGPLPAGFQKLAQGSALGIPNVAFYAVGVALLAWYVLEHTPLGRRAHAIGANVEAARLAGVRTKGYVFGCFVVSGALAAFAGLLVSAKVGTVSPQLGPSYLLPAFAACFLGATQFKPGRYNVWGAVLALVLLATGVKGLQLAGGQVWVTDAFNGLALVGAVTVAVLVQKRSAARRREAADAATA